MTIDRELNTYILLIRSFVQRRISAIQFEQEYSDLFKNQTSEMPEDLYLILNQLFTDVDAFCGIPDLKDEEDLDEKQLVECASNALDGLLSLK